MVLKSIFIPESILRYHVIKMEKKLKMGVGDIYGYMTCTIKYKCIILLFLMV